MSTKTARLFANGGSQAVRLPAEFRFEGNEVYVRRDPKTGDVILSSKPVSTWAEFMALRQELGVVDDFIQNREQSAPRDPFADWKE